MRRDGSRAFEGASRNFRPHLARFARHPLPGVIGIYTSLKSGSVEGEGVLCGGFVFWRKHMVRPVLYEVLEGQSVVGWAWKLKRKSFRSLVDSDERNEFRSTLVTAPLRFSHARADLGIGFGFPDGGLLG